MKIGSSSIETKRISLAANPPNSANGCRLGRSSGLAMASPYTTLRVYRYAAAYRASFAGLRSASKLAPRSPARSQVYGLDWVWAFYQVSSSRRGQSQPLPEPPDRGRGKGCVPGLPGKAARSEGRPWDAVPRHGEAVDQVAEPRIGEQPRSGVSVRGVRGVRGKNLLQFCLTLTCQAHPPAIQSSDLQGVRRPWRW